MSLFMTLLAVLGAALAGSDEEYRIGPSDVLDITIHGHDFGSGQYTVSASGDVSFPYVGQVHLAGLTPFEAETAMRGALQDGYLVDPHVGVRVQEYRSQTVEVLGAVQKPGVVYLDGPTTIRSIVGEAGGVQSERSTGQIVLTQRSGETLTVPLAELEGPLGDLRVHSGDIVRVDEGRMVFVAGEVAKPGAVPFVEGITVLEALVQAGGSTAVARLSGAYVLRGEERLEVNLRRVIRGKGADVALKPGDRIVIPESPL